VRQDDLHPAPGSKKNTKRFGRGYGSGHGGYAGRGCKGQKSRSGPVIPRGFEGGQNPLNKRLPQKRGFNNKFRIVYSIVSLEKLHAFDAGSEVTPDTLFKNGLIETLDNPVKILANGEIEYPLTVKASKISKTAKAKIEAAGGNVEELQNAAEAK
jgi:large subunit ribosomal protein L15